MVLARICVRDCGFNAAYLFIGIDNLETVLSLLLRTVPLILKSQSRHSTLDSAFIYSTDFHLCSDSSVTDTMPVTVKASKNWPLRIT